MSVRWYWDPADILQASQDRVMGRSRSSTHIGPGSFRFSCLLKLEEPLEIGRLINFKGTSARA